MLFTVDNKFSSAVFVSLSKKWEFLDWIYGKMGIKQIKKGNCSTPFLLYNKVKVLTPFLLYKKNKSPINTKQ